MIHEEDESYLLVSLFEGKNQDDQDAVFMASRPKFYTPLPQTPTRGHSCRFAYVSCRHCLENMAIGLFDGFLA